MSLETLTAYWAPLAASVIGVVLVLFVGWRVWLQSPRGQLSIAKRGLRARAQEAAILQPMHRRGHSREPPHGLLEGERAGRHPFREQAGRVVGAGEGGEMRAAVARARHHDRIRHAALDLSLIHI